MKKKTILIGVFLVSLFLVSLTVQSYTINWPATEDIGFEVEGEGFYISEKGKQIDEIWQVLRIHLSPEPENKVYDPNKNGWFTFEEVYGGGGTSGTACSNVPIELSKVKTFSNSLHGAPGSGHGWVSCGSPYCAVDLRPGTTCEEASTAAKQIVSIKTPIKGKVSQFPLDDYGKLGSCVIVTDSSSDSKAVLCHVDSTVAAGSEVKAGDIVGKLTDWNCGTGIFGPHLHFELRLNGNWISGDGFLGTWKNQLSALGCSS